MHTPVRVLFLSDSNSARTQMAEALLRSLGGAHYEVHSAGLDEPAPVHPLAIQVMTEIGLDLSAQHSKHLNDYLDTQFDYVITLCDRSREHCPDFARDGETLHWGIAAPDVSADGQTDTLGIFRQERDELRRLIEDWLGTRGAGA